MIRNTTFVCNLDEFFMIWTFEVQPGTHKVQMKIAQQPMDLTGRAGLIFMPKSKSRPLVRTAPRVSTRPVVAADSVSICF